MVSTDSKRPRFYPVSFSFHFDFGLFQWFPSYRSKMTKSQCPMRFKVEHGVNITMPPNQKYWKTKTFRFPLSLSVSIHVLLLEKSTTCKWKFLNYRRCDCTWNRVLFVSLFLAKEQRKWKTKNRTREERNWKGVKSPSFYKFLCECAEKLNWLHIKCLLTHGKLNTCTINCLSIFLLLSIILATSSNYHFHWPDNNTNFKLFDRTEESRWIQ